MGGGEEQGEAGRNRGRLGRIGRQGGSRGDREGHGEAKHRERV